MSKNNACIVPVLGATGSGKSEFLKRMLARKKVKRLVIWNPLQKKTAYPFPVVDSIAALSGIVFDEKNFNVVLDPGHWDFELLRRQFNLVCKIILEAENITFIAEELKYVTRAQSAPDNWRRVTGDGRQYGLRVFGTSQRPAQIDKDFLANATMIRTGRMAYTDDIDTVQKYMRIDRDALERLKPLDWIEKNMETGEEASGVLTF